MRLGTWVDRHLGQSIGTPDSCRLRTTVPRYYFDIENGGLQLDETGTECADLNEVRKAAMQTLPEIARFETEDGDRHTFTVIARDADRHPVFTTTLSLTGL